MRTCQKHNCNNQIPSLLRIDGKVFNLQRRKFCLICSPFKSHNTKNLNKKAKSSYEHVKAFRKRKKQKAIDYKGGKCHVCGYSRCNEAMTFHHLDPERKDFSIADVTSWGFDRIKSELDKTILLCCRCHTELHNGIITL